MANQPIGTQADRQSVYHILKDSATTPASYQTGASNPVAAASYWSPNPTVKNAPVMVQQPANLMAPTAMEPVSTPEPNRIIVPNATPVMSSVPAPAFVIVKPVPVSVPKPMPMPEGPRTPVMLPVSVQPTPMVPPTSVMAAPPAPMTPVMPVTASVTTPALDPTAAEVHDWATKALQCTTPAERHAAIRQLVRYDWKQQPMVASALLAGAKADPVDAVRVDCLRHIAAFKMNHPQVIAGVGAMVNDADPWVRQEAVTALGQLKAGQ